MWVSLVERTVCLLYFSHIAIIRGSSQDLYWHLAKQLYLLIINISYLSFQLILTLWLMTLLLSELKDKNSTNIRAFALFTWTTCYAIRTAARCRAIWHVSLQWTRIIENKRDAVCAGMCLSGARSLRWLALWAISLGSWLVWHKLSSTWLVFMSAEENVVIINLYSQTCSIETIFSVSTYCSLYSIFFYTICWKWLLSCSLAVIWLAFIYKKCSIKTNR